MVPICLYPLGITLVSKSLILAIKAEPAAFMNKYGQNSTVKCHHFRKQREMMGQFCCAIFLLNDMPLYFFFIIKNETE